MIYINDFPEYLQHSTLRLFADDSIIYKEIKTINDAQNLQLDLDAACRWEKDWKLVPPLLKNLFSSIYWQLCIISSQKWCLHICLHGQKMLSYEYAYMCMQMRAANIEKPNFVNIWKTMHDNIMTFVSTHMFPWSRIIILSLKML